jgi:hypothetical protein
MDAPELYQGQWRLPAAPVLLLLLFAAEAGADDCPLRMVEPPLEQIAEAARSAPPELLQQGLASEDPAVRHLAIVAEWYAARGGADSDRPERASEALLGIWNAYRPAARLMRIVGAGLAVEGEAAPERSEVRRRLSQMGDRESVLIRAGALLESGEASEAQLEEALRGVNVMALTYDPQALHLAGELQSALGETQGAARTRVFRAELGDQQALVRLAPAYAAADDGSGHCEDRAALLEGLFGTSASGER